MAGTAGHAGLGCRSGGRARCAAAAGQQAGAQAGKRLAEGWPQVRALQGRVSHEQRYGHHRWPSNRLPGDRRHAHRPSEGVGRRSTRLQRREARFRGRRRRRRGAQSDRGSLDVLRRLLQERRRAAPGDLLLQRRPRLLDHVAAHGGFGPRRIVTATDAHTPAAPYSRVNNSFSLLDASDLVFIDAPGTGFSRIAGKDKEKAFFGVDGDAYAFAEFISEFLSKYARWNSPKYLFGESYGTPRSAVVVNQL